jgi:hypothetical protein
MAWRMGHGAWGMAHREDSQMQVRKAGVSPSNINSVRIVIFIFTLGLAYERFL